jgi:hypothetical protein
MDEQFLFFTFNVRNNLFKGRALAGCALGFELTYNPRVRPSGNAEVCLTYRVNHKTGAIVYPW